MSHAALTHDHRQNQTLTPRLQQAVRLLQLSALDYEQELHDMMSRNPFLELDDAEGARASGSEPAETALMSVADRTEADTGSEPADSAPGDGTADGASGWESDGWLQAPGSLRDGAKEPHASATDMMVSETDLRQQLRSQANMLRLSPRDHALVCTLIESMDDDGYLRTDLAEIAALPELDPPADLCEANTALRLVQSFGPAGIGARDVRECLTLQLEKVDPANREVARLILADCLELLARRDLAGMATRLKRDSADIEAACQALRRLDPRPGWRFARSDAQYVTPDVVVRKIKGKWVAQLNAAVKPKLRLNRSCTDLFQRHREARHAELGAHLQEARWTLRNIEQRFSTILDVAQAILRRQHMFFEHGPLAMKPLALRDIAREIGVHESTVCRVTNNKYMATPAGLFELKHFFSRAMPMTNGGSSTGTAIRSVVQELIDGENPDEPLSDVAIAQRLAREGLTVARRTVTKYRQAMKIAPAERRRALGATDRRAAPQAAGESLQHP